jgi:AhpC/TSA family
MAASRRLLGAAAAVMMIGAIAACGSATVTNPPASQGASAPSPAPAALTTIDGRQVSVPGSAPTALLFFSFSCGECVGGGKSLAQAQASAQQAGSKAGFLLVDMDPHESAQDAARFRDQIGGKDLPAVVDTGATLSRTYKISALTTVIVVDPAGKVTYQGHAPSADQILAHLDKAAGK